MRQILCLWEYKKWKRNLSEKRGKYFEILSEKINF